ncbi:wd sam and u-box domain-containing protein 1 [Nannochloropsis oceanica]
MSSYSRNTCSVVSQGGGISGLAHGTDRGGNAPLVPTASVSLPTATTHCPLLIRPAHSGRKSFSEALYRALLRLAPKCKTHIQAVFRFFKVRTKLSHQQVQQILISALGLELQEHPCEQQRQHQQLQPNATATHTRPRPLRREEEEEPVRRVQLNPVVSREMEPQAMRFQQNTVSWHANESLSFSNTASASASAAEEETGISLVLVSLSCPPSSPSLHGEDQSPPQESTTSTITAATRAAAAAISPASSSMAPRSTPHASSVGISVDLEDEDLLLQDAPNAFVCPISLQLMTRAVVAGDGYSYQREALDTWILRNRRERKPLRSPMTNAPMAPFYIPSFTLRSMVSDYVNTARASHRREKGGAHVVED